MKNRADTKGREGLIRSLQRDKHRRNHTEAPAITDAQRANLIQDFKDRGGSISRFLDRELIDGGCSPTKSLRNSDRGLPKDTFDS